MSKKNEGGGNLKAVVVAGDTQALFGLCQSLKAAGFAVTTFTRACTASRRIDIEAYDCLVIDCLLESGTADDIITHSRRAAACPNFATPIVLLSRNFDAELLRKHAANIGAAMIKPIDPSMIADAARSLCDERRLALGSESPARGDDADQAQTTPPQAKAA